MIYLFIKFWQGFFWIFSTIDFLFYNKIIRHAAIVGGIILLLYFIF